MHPLQILNICYYEIINAEKYRRMEDPMNMRHKYLIVAAIMPFLGYAMEKPQEHQKKDDPSKAPILKKTGIDERIIYELLNTSLTEAKNNIRALAHTNRSCYWYINDPVITEKIVTYLTQKTFRQPDIPDDYLHIARQLGTQATFYYLNKYSHLPSEKRIASATPAPTLIQASPAKEYTAQDIRRLFSYDKNKLEEYFNRMCLHANLFALQDEYVGCIEKNYHQTVAALGRMSGRHQKASMAQVLQQQISDILLQKQPFSQEPEYIALALETAAKITENPSTAASLIEKYRRRNTPISLHIATLLSKEQPLINDIIFLKEAGTKARPLGPILKELIKIIEAKDQIRTPAFVEPFKKNIVVILENPQIMGMYPDPTNNDDNWKNLLNTTLEKRKEPNDLVQKFYKSYKVIQSEVHSFYKALKEEINTTLAQLRKKNRVSATVATKKIYTSFIGSDTLPNTLPEAVTPSPIVEQIAPAQPAPANAAIHTKAPKTKNKKKKKKQQSPEWSNSAETKEVAQPPSPTQSADTTQKAPSKENKIECIKDALHNQQLYVYRAIKHADSLKPFAYHNRIYAWIKDKNKALHDQGYMDPENPKYVLRHQAAANHGFSLDIDKYALKYGSRKMVQNKNGKDVLFLALPGHREKDGKRTFILYGYVIDPITNICYHRCIEERTAEELLHEYLRDNTWKITLDELEI